jgi:flagellar P-ring protein precursor FlgI
MLKRMGLNIPIGSIAPENMAVVMVTGTLPPFARPGSKIDLTVSSIGDATSLRGGQLVNAFLTGYDNRTVYAIGQGAVSTGAVTAQGASGSKETINHPTVGRIPSGAVVEKEIPQQLVSRDNRVTLLLRGSNFATAKNLVTAVNAKVPGTARAIDGLSVEITIPTDRRADPVSFVAEVGDIQVTVRPRAVVVINERTGTIIAGGDVVILPGTITHSNLSISVRETLNTSQPPALSNGETRTTPASDIEIRETGTPMIPIPKAVGAGEVAKALNALGTSPLDLISIFQSLKRAGLLQAELVLE